VVDGSKRSWRHGAPRFMPERELAGRSGNLKGDDMGPLGRVFSVISGLVIVQGAPAHAANAVSRAIERTQPCSTVKATKIGITIGVDNFKSAELESLKIDVIGDDAKIAVVGSLACRTSDKSTFPGDASARFSAAVELNLASCAISQNSVRILSTGGTYGFAVDAFRGTIERAIESSISDQVKALCR
jgi:hypothetical protein